MKIAPMLTMAAEGLYAMAEEDHREAVRELRALLAVARAARRLATEPAVNAEEEALNRALARLERASGRKP